MKPDENELFELNEGDIFYTLAANTFQLYKLLHHEESHDVYHVLCYVPFTALPGVDEIDTFKISIYHTYV